MVERLWSSQQARCGRVKWGSSSCQVRTQDPWTNVQYNICNYNGRRIFFTVHMMKYYGKNNAVITVFVTTYVLPISKWKEKYNCNNHAPFRKCKKIANKQLGNYIQASYLLIKMGFTRDYCPCSSIKVCVYSCVCTRYYFFLDLDSVIQLSVFSCWTL